MEFEYALVGIGWAAATLSDSESGVELSASYVGDALADLLDAVLRLLEGAGEARCSWAEEPGEFRWLFARSDSEVHLRVLEFGDYFGDEPDHRGVLVFETRQSLDALAGAVATGAQEVLDDLGESGYLAQWLDFPFPVRTLAEIRRILSSS